MLCRITVTGGVLWRMRNTDTSPFEDKVDGLDLFSLAYSDVYTAFGGNKNLGVAFNLTRRVSATTQDEAGPGGVLYNFGQTYLNPNSDNPLTVASTPTANGGRTALSAHPPTARRSTTASSTRCG